MRVCIETATGKLIESQSGGVGEADLDTLRNNALAAGLSLSDLDIKYVTAQEYAVILESQPKTEAELQALEARQLRRKLISANVWLFRMVSVVWTTGVSKGLWAAADITDADLKAKYVEWQTMLNRLKELGE
uniref:Uncharacterized protein n=1 Tax=viral metagenome TaxID=1070528 RepID=A0A6H1ZME9_9ZZZZ